MVAAKLPKEVILHDIRGFDDRYTLDTTGFQIVDRKSKEKDFLNIKQVKKVYFPEVEDLLQKVQVLLSNR